MILTVILKFPILLIYIISITFKSTIKTTVKNISVTLKYYHLAVILMVLTVMFIF
jgi:hypothetical protein